MHLLTPVTRVKFMLDPNLLILFIGVKTIVKNEHFRDRDAFTPVMGVKIKQDPNLLTLLGVNSVVRNKCILRDRDSSPHSCHECE